MLNMGVNEKSYDVKYVKNGYSYSEIDENLKLRLLWVYTEGTFHIR